MDIYLALHFLNLVGNLLREVPGILPGIIIRNNQWGNWQCTIKRLQLPYSFLHILNRWNVKVSKAGSQNYSGSSLRCQQELLLVKENLQQLYQLELRGTEHTDYRTWNRIPVVHWPWLSVRNPLQLLSLPLLSWTRRENIRKGWKTGRNNSPGTVYGQNRLNLGKSIWSQLELALLEMRKASGMFSQMSALQSSPLLNPCHVKQIQSHIW